MDMDITKTLCKQCEECKEHTYHRTLQRRGLQNKKIFKFKYCEGNKEIVTLCNWGPSSPKNKDGRVYVTSTMSFEGKRHQFEVFLKSDPENVISYINKDTLDNRLCNLREIKKVCSAQTVIGEDSIFPGVTKSSFYKHYQKGSSPSKWMARTKINGKILYLGLFDTELEAADAYYRKIEEIGRPINRETPAYRKYKEWLKWE